MEGWIILIGVVAIIALWALGRRREVQDFERSAFEATVTRVEEDSARPLAGSRLTPGDSLEGVWVTFRTADGVEDSFRFTLYEARRYAPHLLRLAPGDRIVKRRGEAYPRRLGAAGISPWVRAEIHWAQTGDVDEPYEAIFDQVRLTVRINPFPGGARYSLFVDGVLEAELDRWPDHWAREY